MAQDLINIVIVGAAAAGATLARALESKLPATHRLVLIDAQDFAFWPISGLRSAVVPGWEDKSFKPLAGFFPSTSRHVLLSSTKVVELGKGFVKVDVANTALGFEKEIPFAICVLALGSLYQFPGRAGGTTMADAKKVFLQAQTTLRDDLQNIVMVGGGPVSIEYAGEIVSQYPGKKNVTIIQSSDTLLSGDWPAKLSARLVKELESRGVKIVFGQRVAKDVFEAGKGLVTLKDGSSIHADLIFNGTGPRPNTKLIESTDSGALDSLGYITVDDNLRIISIDPKSPLVNGYFAMGDAAGNKGGATAIKAGTDAVCIEKNILATIASKPLVAVGMPLHALIVPVGPSGGAGSIPYIGVIGGFMTGMAKGKGLLLPMFNKLYPSST